MTLIYSSLVVFLIATVLILVYLFGRNLTVLDRVTGILFGLFLQCFGALPLYARYFE